MKFSTPVCLFFVASIVDISSAFAPSVALPTLTPCTNSELYATQSSRSEFLSQAGAIIAGGVTISGMASPAMAAKYGDFGAGSPAVLDPKEAEIDSDILKSNDVQSAIKKVKGYQAAVNEMQAALKANGQVDVRKTILKDLDFADLRATMNTVNTAFEEDTQRGTDRLIRVILQDITELEQANAQKEGIPRSDRRVGIMEGKLSKLDKAFQDFLAFSN